MSAAPEVFLSYSHKDEDLCERLRTHLSLLQRLGHIDQWHDRRITAGAEWAGEIDEHLRSARVILLLISADFLASDYCYDIEAKLALDRHARGEAVVIPVILRPTDWTGAPFAKLQALPRDGKAVTLWANQDEAFALISRGIRQAIAKLSAGSGEAVPEPEAAAAPVVVVEGERVLDAAIAQQVFVGRPTELLIQVRRSESGGLKVLLAEEPEIGITPDQVRAKTFELSWPVGPDGTPEDVRIQVNVDAPSFAPPRQSKTILVPPDDDSEVCSFLMTPRQTGPLLVQVELGWNEAAGPQRTLRTRCEAEGVEAARPRMHVVSMPAFAMVGAAVGGWSSSTIFGYALPAAAGDSAPAPSSPASVSPPPPVPPRRPSMAGWGKGVALSAMVAVAIGVGITQVSLMQSTKPPADLPHIASVPTVPAANLPHIASVPTGSWPNSRVFESRSAKAPPADFSHTASVPTPPIDSLPRSATRLPHPSVRPDERMKAELPRPEQREQWLTLNRPTIAGGGFELETRWVPAWGDPAANRGYRITGVPETAALFETVRCGPGLEHKFVLRPVHPELLKAVEVCPLVLNLKTHTWDRTAASCRTVPVGN